MGSSNILLADNGDLHKRHRKTIAPAFTFLRLKDMSTYMSAAATRAVDKWLEPLTYPFTAPGTDAKLTPRYVDIEMESALMGVTLNIIGEAAFGIRPDDGTSAGVKMSVFTVFASLVANALDDAFRVTALLPFYNKLQHARRAPAVARLRGELRRLLTDRRAARAAAPPTSHAETVGGAQQPQLLVDVLLDATADPQDTSGNHGHLTIDEVLDEAMTFVFAGES